MIEKNQFHLQKKGVNDILIKRDSAGLKGAKIGNAPPPGDSLSTSACKIYIFI